MTTTTIDPVASEDIASHSDPCACGRCAGLESCPFCQRVKLDADYCYSCRRLVFLNGRFRTRAEVHGESPPGRFFSSVE